MRAETGSGPPTPACWASMSMVSRGAGWNPECVCVGGGGGRSRSSPPRGRNAGRIGRSGHQETGRSSPGGPASSLAFPWEWLPETRPVGGRSCRSLGNSAALGCGWRQGGGRAETSHCARRVAGRLRWHRHQFPVPLPQRARGGRGRRLLQSAPFPVPVRTRQGKASWSLPESPGSVGAGGPGCAVGATRPSLQPRHQVSCTVAMEVM